MNKNLIEDETNEKPVEKIIGYARKSAVLFSDFERNSYAEISINGHKEIYPIYSISFRDWLLKQFYYETHTAPSNSALDNAIQTINAIAQHDGEKKEVYLRIAQPEKNKIYIDLCNDDWQVIEVSMHGWKVIDDSPVPFIRTENMKPFSKPINNGDINLLLKHFNINKKDLPLLVGWLIMSLQAGPGAYPVMIINGNAGTGKTTASRMLRKLIDPNKIETSSKPKIEDLRVMGNRYHLFSFDNLSGISPSFSDSICKFATGDNQSVRKLYTTNDELTISIKKPCLMNCIDEIAKRGDLVSRSVKLNLNKIHHRKTESQVWNDFNDDIPSILGALMDGLVSSILYLPAITIDDVSRMADFCQIATAATRAYGWNENLFMEQYKANIESTYIDSMESSQFGNAIMKMFETKIYFKGTPMQLLEKLEDMNCVSDKVMRSKSWVTTAKGVVGQLDRFSASMEVLGIEYEKYRDRTNKTIIRLEKHDREFEEITE